MKKQIKTKWLDALRSGEYKQAKSSLKEGDSFCCLGVLCELHRQETNGDEWVETGYKMKPTDPSIFKYFGNTVVLPPEVVKWAGLGSKGRAPEVTFSEESKNLTELNDIGMTFIEIADLIEADM